MEQIKQTAVDWFYTKLIIGKFTGKDTIDFLYETAKEMQKEQIEDAYTTGVEEDVYSNPLRTGEMYYNEQYGK